MNRNFIPDSGRLLHVRLPKLTEDVRVDAGFVEGDEVSSFYDPMIAKLIVRAPTREEALYKLKDALEQYEIAGPVTNIEFLKRACVSPDFVAGNVETGYIDKHREELFKREPPQPELYAQAALGLLHEEIKKVAQPGIFGTAGSSLGFTQNYQQREFHLANLLPDGKSDGEAISVKVRQSKPSSFDISVNGVEFLSVKSNATSNLVTTFYPHTRIETTLVRDEERLTLFQQGKQHRLLLVVPKWAEKALGIKDVTNSVLAPMPCKVLRVEVQEGDVVKKDQPLVVIESMKMETVIRSPQEGVISKVMHKQGVSSHDDVIFLMRDCSSSSIGSLQSRNGPSGVRRLEQVEVSFYSTKTHESRVTWQCTRITPDCTALGV